MDQNNQNWGTPPANSPPGGTPPPQGGAPAPGWGAGAPPPPSSGSLRQAKLSGYVPSAEEKQTAFYAHLFGLIGMLIGLSFIGPIVALAMSKAKGPFAIFHANQAFWLHVVMFGASLVLGVAGVVLCFPYFLIPVVYIVGALFGFLTMLKANDGHWEEIPIIGDQVLDSNPLLS